MIDYYVRQADLSGLIPPWKPDTIRELSRGGSNRNTEYGHSAVSALLGKVIGHEWRLGQEFWCSCWVNSRRLLASALRAGAC